MAESPEIVWMTYREAGDRLGIKTDSVRRRAASRKWQRRPGNDGKARVGIPADVIPDNTPAPIPDNSPDITPDSISIELAEARAEIAGLRMKVESMELRLQEVASDRDAWRVMAQKVSEPRPGILNRIFGRS